MNLFCGVLLVARYPDDESPTSTDSAYGHTGLSTSILDGTMDDRRWTDDSNRPSFASSGPIVHRPLEEATPVGKEWSTQDARERTRTLPRSDDSVQLVVY